MHSHVDVNGEVIRHEHMTDHLAHYYWDPWHTSWRETRADATSVHYPDIDGKPDPRGVCRVRMAAVKEAEALLDKALGLLRNIGHIDWPDKDAFLARPEVKARLEKKAPA